MFGAKRNVANYANTITPSMFVVGILYTIWTATKNNLTFAVTLQTTYNHVSGNTAIDNTTARYHQLSVILMPLINRSAVTENQVQQVM